MTRSCTESGVSGVATNCVVAGQHALLARFNGEDGLGARDEPGGFSTRDGGGPGMRGGVEVVGAGVDAGGSDTRDDAGGPGARDDAGAPGVTWYAGARNVDSEGSAVSSPVIFEAGVVDPVLLKRVQSDSAGTICRLA